MQNLEIKFDIKRNIKVHLFISAGFCLLNVCYFKFGHGSHFPSHTSLLLSFTMSSANTFFGSKMFRGGAFPGGVRQSFLRGWRVYRERYFFREPRMLPWAHAFAYMSAFGYMNKHGADQKGSKCNDKSTTNQRQHKHIHIHIHTTFTPQTIQSDRNYSYTLAAFDTLTSLLASNHSIFIHKSFVVLYCCFLCRPLSHLLLCVFFCIRIS